MEKIVYSYFYLIFALLEEIFLKQVYYLGHFDYQKLEFGPIRITN